MPRERLKLKPLAEQMIKLQPVCYKRLLKKEKCEALQGVLGKPVSDSNRTSNEKTWPHSTHLVKEKLEIFLLVVEAPVVVDLVEVDSHGRPEGVVEVRGCGVLRLRLVLRRVVQDLAAGQECRVVVVDDVAEGATVRKRDREVLHLQHRGRSSEVRRL